MALASTDAALLTRRITDGDDRVQKIDLVRWGRCMKGVANTAALMAG